MILAVYVVFTAVFSWLTWQSWNVYKSKWLSYALLLLIVIAGLTYDVLIILLGHFLPEGGLLRTLNIGRFVIHALATPLLIIFGFGVVRHGGLGWAQSRTNHILICVLATLLIGFGVYEDIFLLNLQFRAPVYTNCRGHPSLQCPLLFLCCLPVFPSGVIRAGSGWP